MSKAIDKIVSTAVPIKLSDIDTDQTRPAEFNPDHLPAFLRGEPCGLSVTAPFKDVAFAFALARNAEIGENALRARAVNTLVNVRGRILADNTDVDGFRTILGRVPPASSRRRRRA